ncbi:diphosphomevalonate decarboxylase [Nowakowskiella sp. JEL0407]|nr:diphosphomevalonate decarboxylase [Nowakowskiella sp. JEL0407]
MALNRTFKLKNGSIMPAFGLGTWKSETNIVGTAVKEALNVGVKLIDCAAVYENEKEIGAVLSTLPRSSFFVTSKLWNSMHDPQDVEPAVRRTLADLGLEYLDLYLIHWPVALVPKRDGTSDSARDPVTGKFMVNHNVTLEQTWKAMEALVDKGLVKSIGCSNFSIPKLKQILSIARIHPVVDQVEMHPFLPQDDLVQFGKENDIVIQAYAPFGSGKTPSLLEHEKIVEVAKKNGKTPAQVLVSWAIQRGTSVIPKSSNPERIRENFQDFILPDEDFKTISEIHLTTPIRFFDPKDPLLIPQTSMMNSSLEVTCTAPVNIAVIKYWGKRNTALLLPTNSSLSVTLSQDHLHSKTTIRASPEFKKDRLWLNNEEEEVSASKRLMNVITEARRLRSELEATNPTLPKLSTWGYHICSENNFPTAAGLASSASGFACLTYSLATLLELPQSTSEISKLARVGSGSACRSLFGGFVAWNAGVLEDGSDSMAEQVAPESHWPEMEALILVASDTKKHVSSTAGMQTTVETSPLLQKRIEIVPQRMIDISKAIKERDFDTFAALTMKDSNSFHAVCLDTFPPIFYLTDVSKAVISVVTAYNELVKVNGKGYRAAYTFDAGPNAVIYAPKQYIPEILAIMTHFFPPPVETASDSERHSEYFGRAKEFLGKEDAGALISQIKMAPFAPGSLRRVISTHVGDGPRVIAHSFKPEISLLSVAGTPKALNK